MEILFLQKREDNVRLEKTLDVLRSVDVSVFRQYGLGLINMISDPLREAWSKKSSGLGEASASLNKVLWGMKKV